MRFGSATHDITQLQRMSMVGCFDRDDAFDGVHDPLTLTALVLNLISAVMNQPAQITQKTPEKQGAGA
jgi:hypothetical protein